MLCDMNFVMSSCTDFKIKYLDNVFAFSPTCKSVWINFHPEIKQEAQLHCNIFRQWGNKKVMIEHTANHSQKETH